MYDEIRPYNDNEIQSILLKHIGNPTLYRLSRYMYPAWSMKDFNTALRNTHNIHSFQNTFIHAAIEKCIQTSIQHFEVSGIHQSKLKTQKGYLYISNHRDIVLDSVLLYYALYQKGYSTGQIAIGDNLVISELTGDLVRLNKSFLVHRNLDTRENLQKLKTLSAYIQLTLLHKKESIWISQREGRTKDGNDKSYPGVLKMIALQAKDKIDYLLNAHIVPVSISYEYDSCDTLKAKECMLKAKLNGKTYQKKPMEDMRSILYGIMQQKGRVHFAFGDEITTHNTTLKSETPQEQIKELCLNIDHQIHKNTKLFPTHYIAYDLLHNNQEYKHHYSKEEKHNFEQRLNAATLKYGKKQAKAYKHHFLAIYSNTLLNTLKAQNTPTP